MAFFRSFLVENNQTPDTTYNENDEAALVLFLLQARLRQSAVDLHVPDGFEAPEHLPEGFALPGHLKELKFVAGFLCFFVSKPMRYMREVRSFREYFTPGFASDAPKQIQLAQALREEFYRATLNDLESATTLNGLFNVDTILEPEPVPA
jgi:hypothetical protein